MMCDLRLAAPVHKAASRLVEPTRQQCLGAGFQRGTILFSSQYIAVDRKERQAASMIFAELGKTF
jgi:hypothetical protein